MVQIEEFWNVHQGERVILVGNGYTLQPTDLDRIADAQIVTMAMNGIAAIYPRTKWRPSYYVCVSTAINDTDYEPVFRLGAQSAQWAFVCSCWCEDWLVMDNVVPIQCVNITDNEEPGDAWLDTPMDGVCKWGTSMTSAAQIAAWMGFKTIYYIGMPGQYSRRRAHIEGYPRPDYEYADHIDQLHVETHEFIAQNLRRLDIEAYNLSRETIITAYPRMKLEDIL